MLPWTLDNVKCFSFSLEIIEKLGVGEQQGEEFINVDVKVSAENLPGILALSPHLVGEDVSDGDDGGTGPGTTQL